MIPFAGSSVQHNEMRPRSSRKDQYDTSGTPKALGEFWDGLGVKIGPKTGLLDAKSI